MMLLYVIFVIFLLNSEHALCVCRSRRNTVNEYFDYIGEKFVSCLNCSSDIWCDNFDHGGIDNFYGIGQLQCDYYMINSGVTEFCSAPPNRLYLQHGSNTSLTAFSKKGTPGHDYHECAQFVRKDKNEEYVNGEFNNNAVKICADIKKDKMKSIESTNFGEKKFKFMEEYDILVQLCICNYKDENKKFCDERAKTYLS